MNKQGPGRLLIINHQIFDDEEKNRAGSDKDVILLRESFGKYNVPSKEIKNPTAIKVTNEIRKLKNHNFDERSCFVCAILSHGDKNDAILSSDLQKYSIWDDIVNPIIQIESLFGKPKIFIIQACKGGIETDRNYNIIPPKNNNNNQGLDFVDSASDNTKNLKRIDPNKVIIFYSTSEDFVSYRVPQEGSLFINKFCDMLEKYGNKSNIDEIFEKTCDAMTKIKDVVQHPSKYVTGGQSKYVFGKYS